MQDETPDSVSPTGAPRAAAGTTIRLRDVARRAHVSPATVSRVLNSSPTVAAPYRERVLRAIAELEYRPNRLARNLRRQHAEMIGVLVADIENPPSGPP